MERETFYSILAGVVQDMSNMVKVAGEAVCSLRSLFTAPKVATGRRVLSKEQISILDGWDTAGGE